MSWVAVMSALTRVRTRGRGSVTGAVGRRGRVPVGGPGLRTGNMDHHGREHLAQQYPQDDRATVRKSGHVRSLSATCGRGKSGATFAHSPNERGSLTAGEISKASAGSGYARYEATGGLSHEL